MRLPSRRAGIAERRHDLREQRRGRRRQVVRHELLEKVAGELGKLVLELELHARREEGRAFEQPGDHRVGALLDEAAEALGDARILVRELGAVLAQEREFAIVEVEEFPVHDAPRAG